MSFISHIHAAIRSARITRKGATARPEDVPRGTHKDYPRFPRITLPAPQPLTKQLDETIMRRRSFHAAATLRPFSLAELGTLFSVALGKASTHPLRHYPSGGALFPIETYIMGNVVEGQPKAVFHYNPSAHALEHLWNPPEKFSTLDVTTTKDIPVGSALLVFTSVWKRSSAKYGDLTYLHAAIEAGHMAQNILLVATALDISTRPVAGFRDDELHTLLDLDTDLEQVVYSIILAPKSDVAQKTIEE